MSEDIQDSTDPRERELTLDDARLIIAKQYKIPDGSLIDEVAEAYLELQKHMPSVMEVMGTKDPRALVFANGLISFKWESLTDACKRLGIEFRTAQKWFSRLAKSNAIDPIIIKSYEAAIRRKKKVENPFDSPRFSSTSQKKDINEQNVVNVVMSELEIPETVTVPKKLFIDLAYHGITGNKMGVANAVSEALGKSLTAEQIIKAVVEKYRAEGGSEEDGLEVDDPSKLLDKLYKDLMKQELEKLKLSMIQSRLAGLSLPIANSNSGFVSRLERLERMFEDILRKLEKQEEEERIKKLEEKIERLSEQITKPMISEEHPEIKRLKEELNELKTKREKEELIDTIKTAFGQKSSIDDLLRFQQQMEQIRQQYITQIEELRKRAEEERNARLLDQTEILRKELESLKSVVSRIHVDPVQQIMDFAERMSKIEEVLKALRKGESPSVSSDIKQQVFDTIKTTISQLMQNLPQLTGKTPAPASEALRIVSMKCTNPNCGNDIPIPDPNVPQIVCPHCGQIYKVEKT
ncbi:MAG: hypothetical protein QXK87_06965 [Fervidicoccaceae archaeon]